MKSETALFLQQSHLRLSNMNRVLEADLDSDAARTAYMASFHATQALIFETVGKIAKTHNGVQAEFYKLTKDDPALPEDLRRFLSQGFDYKTTADYAIGPAAQTSREEAEGASAIASRFVSYVDAVLAKKEPRA